jgi:tRNA G46 methylase TrmB
LISAVPEALQLSWIGELTRVLKPGGLLLIATHGKYYLQYLTSNEKDRFRSGQLVVHSEEAAGSNACVAFHPIEYVRRKPASGLAVIDFVPEGALGNPRQDVSLLRKPANASDGDKRGG